MRLLALLALGAVALVLVASGSGASGAAPAAAGRTIVVTGDGSVSAVPDRADFSFGVSTSAPTAAVALQANAAELGAVLAALKRKGIAPADLRTELVALSPRYSDNGLDVIGYAATNSVDVTLRDLGGAGGVIDAAVAAGANQISGPNLVASDEATLYRQALQAAVADAKGKAEAIAGAAGLTLLRIMQVDEQSASPPLPLAAKGAAAPSTPIEPGTQTVEATVQVTFSVS